MAITIKYIGTADNYAEIAVTGKQSVWQVGQQEERPDAEAGQLLATGLFSSPPLPVMASTKLTGGSVILDPITGLPMELGGGSLARSGAVTMMPYGDFLTPASSAANMTMQVNLGVKKPSFYGVRLAFFNVSTTLTKTVFAKVAACPTLLNKGSTLPYVGVTFGGASTVVIPVATTTAAGEIVKAVVYSDVIPVMSVPRTDTPGDWPLISVRVHDMNTSGVAFTRVDEVQRPVNWFGLPLASTNEIAGDLVTMTTTDIAVSTASNWIRNTAVFSVDFFTGGAVCKMAVFGASQSASPAFTYPLLREIAAAGKPGMSLANYSFGGSGIYHQSQTLRTVCTATKPDIATLWSVTVNTTYSSQAERDAQFKQVYEDVLWLKSQGIKPVVFVRWSGNGQILLDYRLRFLEAMNDVCTLIDVGGAVSDPADMRYIRSDLGGTTHLNPDGCEVLAAYAGPLLAKLI